MVGYHQVHRELQAVSDDALASVVPSIKAVSMLAQLHRLATLHLHGFALVLGRLTPPSSCPPNILRAGG